MDSITSGLPTSTLSTPKFKIHQTIPSGYIKKGPYAVVRSADLNDAIEIKRRFGEGSKPLFARDDIAVNQAISDSHDVRPGHDSNVGCKSKSNRSSSTESSSPERYRHRESKKHLSPNRRKSPEKSTCNERANHDRDKNAYNSKYNNTRTDKLQPRGKRKSPSPLPVKRRPTGKLPYYRDEQREKDRLRRLYGHSCSRSPPATSTKTNRYITKRRIESPPRRRRSTSRERQRRYSYYHTSRRDYRNRRSRTRSRTRSPHRSEHLKHSSKSSKDREKEHKEDSSSVAIAGATPQYIPIPVAVPADYAAYSFPGWTGPQPPWQPSHRPPPASHFTPFPMWPMMPPIRPPHQAPYAGMPPNLPFIPIAAQYRPRASQRCPPPRHITNTYISRPKKNVMGENKELAYGIPQFNGCGYDNWQFRIKIHLDSLNIVDVLTDDPPEEANAKAEFFKKDKKAKDRLVSYIHADCLSYVRDKQTAKEMWTSLELAFAQKPLVNRLLLRRQLATLRMNPGDSIKSHLEHFENIIGQLKMSGANIEDGDLITQIFISLPEKFDPLVTELQNIDESKLTFGFIKERLMSEEIKLYNRADTTAGEKIAFSSKKYFKRKFNGEGFKPLFARDDIAVNQAISDSHDVRPGHDSNVGCKSKSNRSSSTESSSPERYRHRESKKHLSPKRRKSPEKSTYNERANHDRDKNAYNSKYNKTRTDKLEPRGKRKSPSPRKRKPTEKLPYYRDEQHEKNRLRRLYGHSRSRSPPESPSRRRRSTSREHTSRRDYRNRRSRTRSRTRSPYRSSVAIAGATPQYIPIPVAVPGDYAAYSFPGWTGPQPPWQPSHRPPPASHFTPFPMWPMMPPIRPPHQAPYAGMPPNLPFIPIAAQYRPRAAQRCPPPRHITNTYISRPKKNPGLTGPQPTRNPSHRPPPIRPPHQAPYAGEGFKPLFARDDIAVNQAISDSHDVRPGHDNNVGCKSKSNRSSSTESSSPERYRHRESKKHLSPNRRKSPEKSTCNERANHDRDNNPMTDKLEPRGKRKSPSPRKRRPTEKLPYYRDEQREKDRLRRLYGHSRSRSPPESPPRRRR